MGDKLRWLQFIDEIARFADTVKRLAINHRRRPTRTKKGAASPEAAPFARGR